MSSAKKVFLALDGCYLSHQEGGSLGEVVRKERLRQQNLLGYPPERPVERRAVEDGIIQGQTSLDACRLLLAYPEANRALASAVKDQHDLTGTAEGAQRRVDQVDVQFERYEQPLLVEAGHTCQLQRFAKRHGGKRFAIAAVVVGILPKVMQ